VSWLEAIHLVISTVIFLIIYVEGEDEPFWLRFGSAALVAFIWLPGLILLLVMLAIDWIAGKLKAFGK
jgi:hypothetical protein